MKIALSAIALTTVLQLSPAFAAAWPDNWLGPPDPGFVTLNIGVFYYGAVIDDFPAEDGTPTLPEGDVNWLEELQGLPGQLEAGRIAELDRIRWEMGEAARFYWRNTRFNLALDYDWHIEQQPILRSTIASGEGPYHSPVDHPAYADLRKQYDGLVQIMVLYKYDEESGTLERVRGGGGFTWGLDAETKECGWSWWAAPPADHSCGSDWLMVHEFGHQLDSMFDQSGHPEVWFNHLSPSEGNVARFGEHFDANSYILRRIPEADWGDLLWGEYSSFADDDNDNVPDPGDLFTNLGLETDPDPSSTDTDSDGMTDYAEIMASNGNRYGHGERLHPAILLCNPNNADTDGDGLADGSDPLPMYPFSNYIPRSSPDNPFEPSLLKIPTAGGIPGLSCKLFYIGSNSWEDEITPGSLEIQIQAGEGAALASSLEIKLMLDLDNDGWFTGIDNYQVILEEDEFIKVIQHGTTDPSGWPQPQSLDVGQLGLVLGKLGTGMVNQGWITLSLSQEHFPELAAKPGEMIGFNIGIKRPGENWFYMVGEPNTLIPLELR